MAADTPREDIWVVLPSLNPSDSFDRVVDGVLAAGFRHLLIVDDGSRAENKAHFERAAAYPQCTVLTHEVNRGKGAALKTGLAWIRKHLPDVAGVVTADADGQHAPDDIRRVAEATATHAGGLVLGVRTFEGHIPFRSRWGNGWTRLLFRMLTGLAIRDTQTGLRGIPADLLDRVTALPGDRYEYETRMLVDARHHASPPLQVPIRTVYLDGNRSSHYRPFRDTLLTQAALWFHRR